MKKIMFNDRYGLTQAVLEGRKTMTRRFISDDVLQRADVYRHKYYEDTLGLLPAGKALIEFSPFKAGEVVAAAQSYGTILDELEDPRNFSCMEHWESKSGDRGKYAELAMYSPGGINKMFVCADEMPHQIRITNIRVERLKDISDEDCIREGIEEDSPYYWVPVNMSLPNWRKIVEGVSDMYPNDRDGKVYPHFWDSPRKAFARLIDKVSGKGTWERNPWVFVYGFELVR